jgi:hypothetical protein
MGWQPFDEWTRRQGLTFDNLPVSSEELLEGPTVATSTPSPDGRRGPRLPVATTGCVVHHKHRRHRPTRTCKCGCAWCEESA